jgi:hypothetical protein
VIDVVNIGDIAERSDVPGRYVAVISDAVVPGSHMVVPIVITKQATEAESSPLHTLGTVVQGHLLPSRQRMYRLDDLKRVADVVEGAALQACQTLFRSALHR